MRKTENKKLMIIEVYHQHKIQSPDSPPERDRMTAEVIYLAMTILWVWVDWMAPRMANLGDE